MKESYTALRVIGTLLRIAAALTLLLGIVGAAIMVFASDHGIGGIGAALATAVGSVATALVLAATGEALTALADIATATRASADALRVGR